MNSNMIYSVMEYINISAVLIYCVTLYMIYKYIDNDEENNTIKKSKKNLIKQRIKKNLFYRNLEQKIKHLNQDIGEVKLKIMIPKNNY